MLITLAQYAVFVKVIQWPGPQWLPARTEAAQHSSSPSDAS